MAVKRITADTLLELALTTLREEIAPDLPVDKRYAAAMVANALEIARREVTTDADTPLWPLLDELYDLEVVGSPKQLAADIRSGKVSEATTPGLGKSLLGAVAAELAIRNPRFLKKAG